jgi:hypothetical protein
MTRMHVASTLGDVNVTLIRSENGATVTLYHDTSSPRPYDLILRVQGTQGIYMGPWTSSISTGDPRRKMSGRTPSAITATTSIRYGATSRRRRVITVTEVRTISRYISS